MTARTKKRPAPTNRMQLADALSATLPSIVRRVVDQVLDERGAAESRAHRAPTASDASGAVNGCSTSELVDPRPCLVDVADAIGMSANDVAFLTGVLREIADGVFGPIPEKEKGNAGAPPKPLGHISEIRDQQERLFSAIGRLREQVDRFRAL